MMRNIEFSFSEVDASLGFWETLASIGLGVAVVAMPLVFKAILLGLGV